MGRGRWALCGWATGTYPPSPYQVREQVREKGTLPLPHHGMGQAGQGLSSQLPPRRRQRAAEKLALSPPPSLSLPLPLPLCSTVPSPAHLTHQSSPPAPPSLFPKVQVQTQPPLPGTVPGYQHRPEDRLRKRLGQPPAPFHHPHPHPSLQRAHGVLVPAVASQPSPRYPQRPRVRVPHRIPSHPLRSAYPLPSHRPMTTTGSGFDLLAGLKCSKRPAIAPSQENDMATFQAQ